MRKLIFLLSVFAAYVSAQDMAQSLAQMMTGDVQAAGKKSFEAKSIVLEHAIDPETYFLGPGDVIEMVIDGRDDMVFEQMISAEGTLSIPAVGSVSVSSMTLAEARQRLYDWAKVHYRTDDVMINLVELRRFLVTVSGAVRQPGIIEVAAMSRASEAIRLVGGLQGSRNDEMSAMDEQPQRLQDSGEEKDVPVIKSQPGITEDEKRASRRRITIQRRSGEKLTVDLEKYFLIGDLDSNPYLVDGDVIVVPFQQRNAGQIAIYGAVVNPGEFEFVPGDRIQDLLELSYGLGVEADSLNIVLSRFTDDAQQVKDIQLPLGNPGTAIYQQTLNTPLQADDRLFVRPIPKYHVKLKVVLKGEVQQPGEYALDQNSRMLSNVIDKAGGFTSTASLADAYIIRSSLLDEIDPELERLMTVQVRDMNSVEREYYKLVTRQQKSVIAVDFTALFLKNDYRYDVLLQDGDVVYVPTKNSIVSVTGQVISPGLYPLNPGKPLKYYVDLAGGYNFGAKKGRIRIIKPKNNSWINGDENSAIEGGDQIFVPQKSEIEWWEVTKDVVVVLAQLATVWLVVDNVNRSSGSN